MREKECYRVRPVFSVEKEKAGRTMVGRCVYVHPCRRFGVLEFLGVHGTIRESFRPEQLTRVNRVERKEDRYGK